MFGANEHLGRKATPINIESKTTPIIDDPFEADIAKQGEWLFKSLSAKERYAETLSYTPQQDVKHNKLSNCIQSLTPNAVQRRVFMEDKPNEFPCTPQTFEGDPLETYMANLTKGAEFFRNHNGAYIVVKSEYSKDEQSIYVMTRATCDYDYPENVDKLPPLGDNNYEAALPYSLSIVEYEDGVYIHDRASTGFMPKEYIEELFKEYTQTD